MVRQPAQGVYLSKWRDYAGELTQSLCRIPPLIARRRSSQLIRRKHVPTGADQSHLPAGRVVVLKSVLALRNPSAEPQKGHSAPGAPASAANGSLGLTKLACQAVFDISFYDLP